jgi:hypothetical protein
MESRCWKMEWGGVGWRRSVGDDRFGMVEDGYNGSLCDPAEEGAAATAAMRKKTWGKTGSRREDNKDSKIGREGLEKKM